MRGAIEAYASDLCISCTEVCQHRCACCACRIRGTSLTLIWYRMYRDVRTGEKKRAFKNEGGQEKVEPFKWSHDDKFFGKVIDDAIQVYFWSP